MARGEHHAGRGQGVHGRSPGGRREERDHQPELAALKRAFSLGIEHGKLTHRPKITMLEERNARTGFFERPLFETVRAKLNAPLRPVVTFAYITGWRVQSEVVPMHWRQVDFEAGTVRLDANTTKNGEGRLFRMTAELRELLEAQRAITDAVQKEQGRIIPLVFHRVGGADRNVSQELEDGLQEGRVPGDDPARLPAYRRPQHGPGRHPRAGRHDHDRAQDPLSLRTLQHRQRR